MPGRGTRHCALVALLCLLTLSASAASADAAKPRKTIARELTKLFERGKIDLATYEADRAIHRDVKATVRRLSGARRLELAGALATVDRMARRGALRASRLAPLFLTLQRNR